MNAEESPPTLESKRDQLAGKQLVVLAHPIRPGRDPREDKEALNIASDADTQLLAVFTEPGLVDEVIKREIPDSSQLGMIVTSIDSLLSNVDADVGVILNPWTAQEELVRAESQRDKACTRVPSLAPFCAPYHGEYHNPFAFARNR